MALGRHTLSIETGKMAKQADGAVVVRLGDTVVLATACAQREPRVGFDFLPLTVDYREGNYASGKIPGGFFKREGRPNEKEVLTSRMIDRPLRPLFPEGYACETQVIGLLLSADLENDSDTLAIIGASTALIISDIPFERPVGAVRVGYWDGAFVVNPATADLKAKSQLNLLVAGTEDAIVMVEASAQEVTEDVLAGALVEGHNVIKQIVAIQKDLRARVGKPKRPFAKKEVDPAIVAEIEGALAEPLLAAARIKGKIESYAPDEEGEGRVRRVHPRGPAGEEGRLRLRLRRAAREAAQARDLRERPPPRRPAVRRGAGDHVRGGRPAPHARLGALHPRRDAGPGDRHPGHLRGLADHRHRAGGRVPQALHAALQLPALLGRGGEVPARPRPPRDRPRGAGGAFAARDAAGRGGLPLHDPHRLGHPRVERVVLDGHRLRRHPRPHGRRACRSRARWRASPWAS